MPAWQGAGLFPGAVVAALFRHPSDGSGSFRGLGLRHEMPPLWSLN